MCIIAYSKKGHKLISDKTIEIMFKHNPHGAGFMVKRKDGKTEWHKGFMSVGGFIEAVRHFPDDIEIAMHFRIATDGEIVPSNTHPFVVSPNMKDLQRLDGAADMVMCHNGIIKYCQTGAKAEFSDTMVFASKVLYPLRDKLSNAYVQRTLENSINFSRMLIFRKNAPTVRLGYWQKDNGVFYSNTSYKEYTYTVKAVKQPATSVGKVVKSITTPAYYLNGVPIDDGGYACAYDGYGYEELD